MLVIELTRPFVVVVITGMLIALPYVPGVPTSIRPMSIVSVVAFAETKTPFDTFAVIVNVSELLDATTLVPLAAIVT